MSSGGVRWSRWRWSAPGATCSSTKAWNSARRASSAGARESVMSGVDLGGTAGGSGRQLALDQAEQAADRAEVVELHVLVLHGDAELALDEVDELHGEHRVDEAEAEDV